MGRQEDKRLVLEWKVTPDLISNRYVKDLTPLLKRGDVSFTYLLGWGNVPCIRRILHKWASGIPTPCPLGTHRYRYWIEVLI